MILPVNNINNIKFSAAKEKKLKTKEHSEDVLLKNNVFTRTRILIDKFSNASAIYPIKGLQGNKNSNFYEFLTMGMVPYLAGSIMFMAVFNAANKYFAPLQGAKAQKLGNHFALGVVLYGVMKSLSKSFVTKPVKMITGIDTEQPFAKVNYELPDYIGDTDITSIEYHRVTGSKDFPRYDLLYHDDKTGKPRNYEYDRIAKKLGLGKNLKNSDQDVKPRIREIATKTDAAKYISSYLWAAVGVGLAFQEPWEKFFNTATLKFWKDPQFKNAAVNFGDSLIARSKIINQNKETFLGKNMKKIGEFLVNKRNDYSPNNGRSFLNTFKEFGKAFIESLKDFYKGKNGTFAEKHAGKALLFTAIASSALGVINACYQKLPKSNSSDVINKNEKYVVN